MVDCNSSFKAVDRYKRNQVLASRTDPPDVGKYTAKWKLIEARPTGKVHYVDEGPNFGTINKQINDIREMKICPHVVRTIEDWASHKAKFQKNPVNGSVTLRSKMEISVREEKENSAKKNTKSITKVTVSIDSPSPNFG